MESTISSGSLRATLGIVVAFLAADDARAGDERTDPPFLAPVDHVKKSSAEWADEFKRSGFTSLNALWCIHFSGDRSKSNVELLREAHSKASEDVQGAIETILIDWNAPYSDLLSVESPDHRPVEDREHDEWTLAEGAFDPPLPVIDGSGPNLLGLVLGEEPFTAARAAITLSLRQEEGRALVRALLRRVADTSNREWRGEALLRDEWRPTQGRAPANVRRLAKSEALGFALQYSLETLGAAADLEVLSEIDDPSSTPEFRTFLLERLDSIARGGTVARFAVRRLMLTCGLELEERESYPYFGHDAQHATSLDPPLLNAPLESLLSDALEADFRWRLRRSDFGNDASTSIANWWGAARRSAIVRDRFITLAMPLVRRDDSVGGDAVFALSHLGADSHELRDAFVRNVDGMISNRSPHFDRIGCLAGRDERTVAALSRAFDAAPNKAELVWPIASTGLFMNAAEGSERDLVQRVAQWSNSRRPGDPTLEAARDEARALLLAFQPDRYEEIPKALRPHALEHAFTFVTALGGDGRAQIAGWERILREPYAEAGANGGGDYWEWSLEYLAKHRVVNDELVAFCFARLVDPESFRSHQEAACKVLMNASLDDRQRAIIAKSTWFNIQPLELRSLAARQGRIAIETVPWFRRKRTEIQASLPWWRAECLESLDAIAKITRLSEDEEGIVRRAIDNGSAVERESALRILTTCIDPGSVSPAVRNAVSRRCNDVDSLVVAAAREARNHLGR